MSGLFGFLSSFGPCLGLVQENLGIFMSVDEKLVSKAKESKNVASVLTARLQWYSIVASASAGKAILVNDSLSRLLSSKLLLKHSVLLWLEDAGKLESSLRN